MAPIATCGGTITGLAYVPPIEPMLDNENVPSLMSLGVSLLSNPALCNLFNSAAISKTDKC